MEAMRVFLSRCAALFQRQKLDEDPDAELRAHIDLAVEDNLRHGMSAEEARTAALRDFGGVLQAKEQFHVQSGLPFLEVFAEDIIYGFRQLRRSPGFTLTAIFTLAVGIGANTAVFSIVNSVLFRPLPVRNSANLVVVACHDPKADYPHELSNADFVDFQTQSEAISDSTAFLINFAGVSTGNRSERILVTYTKDNYFSFLGVQPAPGRFFLPGTDDASITGDRRAPWPGSQPTPAGVPAWPDPKSPKDFRD